MEIPTGTQFHFSQGLLLSASFLALWVPQGSWAALRIQQIPEQPVKDQNLLLSVQGIPDSFQDFIWYQGKEADGATRLFSYFPYMERPQRDGSAMKQRDITGFPNGSMLLRHAQPSDSGTYRVSITINPKYSLWADTEVQVAEKLPVSTGNVVAIIIGSLAAGSLIIGILACLLITRGRRGRSHRGPTPGGQGSLSVLFPAVSPASSTAPSSRIATTEKPELGPSQNSGDDIYEVMPSPVFLVSPLSDRESTNAAAPPPLPLPPRRQRTTSTRICCTQTLPHTASWCQPPEGVPSQASGQGKAQTSPGGLTSAEKADQRPSGARPSGLRG